MLILKKIIVKEAMEKRQKYTLNKDLIQTLFDRKNEN